MSKALSAAGRTAARHIRSTHIPDGYSRGRRLVEELELPIVDDTAGDAIFTPEPRPEVEDRWTRLADAIEIVTANPLVKKYGFSPDSLITAVDSDQPVAMGFDVLAITLAACQAAKELADLAGEREVCRVLGWTGNTPPAIKHFGADRLFKGAGTLQASIEQIKAERSRPAPQAISGSKPRLALPTRQASPTPAQQSRPAAPKTSPISPELRVRIEAAQKAAIRLNSPGTTQKLNEALATTHSKERAERLVADAEQMLRVCEATTRATPAPRASTPAAQQARPAPRIGKTERERMKKLVKAGKLSPYEYETKTGYRL